MKGAIVEKAGDEPKVVDDLPKPKPDKDQVLVKSLWTAINPVYVPQCLINTIRFLFTADSS